MAEVAFVLDPVGFYKEFRSWEGDVGQFIRKKTIETRVLATVEAPRPGSPPRNRTLINYATGRLAAEHVTSYSHAGRGDDLEGRVAALPEYAIMLHSGTAPHLITPRHPGGMLRFFWVRTGKIAVLPRVHHPGTMANPWLLRALKRAFVGSVSV